MRKVLLLSSMALLLSGGRVLAGAYFDVSLQPLRDEKEVAATVESRNVIPARVRTGGSIVSLSVREGDPVRKGQVVAVIADRRLAQQAEALDAQIIAMKAEKLRAEAELERNRPLFDNGVLSQTAMDSLRTAATVAASSLKARIAERAALEEQINQGKVLAPADGRVLTVPAALGAVMMSGEVVATVAQDDMIVRVRLPERNAASLALGQTVRLDGANLPAQGTVSLIYPEIEQGQVQADLTVAGAAGYHVGQRLRAWIPMEPRPALVVPADCLTTRFGVDYVRLHHDSGQDVDVPVQRGSVVPAMADGSPGVEILSGLKAGDQLVRP